MTKPLSVKQFGRLCDRLVDKAGLDCDIFLDAYLINILRMTCNHFIELHGVDRKLVLKIAELAIDADTIPWQDFEKKWENSEIKKLWNV